jgi:hypothetical protein
MIGHIAETKLREKSPSVLEKIFKMLEPLQTFLPETKDSLIEAPVIPLEIKSGYYGLLENFLFSNTPLVYWKEAESDVNIGHPPNLFNITYAMNQTQLVVKQGLDPQHEKSSPIKGGLLDGLMLRYMMTLTGNLHNPTNIISFFSKNLKNKKYINGDDGGRKIRVIDVFYKGITNLHELFITGFGLFDMKDLELPYSDEVKASIVSQANYLVGLYPEESFKNVDNLNYFDWENEVYSIAEEFVYSQVELFPVLSPEYIIEGRKVTQKQIVLAGYRLYKLLIEIFGKNYLEDETSSSDDSL